MAHGDRDTSVAGKMGVVGSQKIAYLGEHMTLKSC